MGSQAKRKWPEAEGEKTGHHKSSVGSRRSEGGQASFVFPLPLPNLLSTHSPAPSQVDSLAAWYLPRWVPWRPGTSPGDPLTFAIPTHLAVVPKLPVKLPLDQTLEPLKQALCCLLVASPRKQGNLAQVT